MIIQKKTLKNVLFLDVETVSLTSNFSDLPEPLQHLWWHKSKQLLNDPNIKLNSKKTSDLYLQKAGIYAEFSKIVCISVGYLTMKRGKPPLLRIKTFQGEEKELLSSFNAMLNEHYDDLNQFFLCGHNIKEFDIPFICKRNIINGFGLPKILSLSGKKPWQVKHLIDTLELWKFGAFKSYTSLALLSTVLGIPAPQDDMKGSMVGQVYWKDNDLDRIVTYCENDILTLSQVVMKFAGQDLIPEENIEIVGKEK
ncbi:MAG: ribonuclease H-like domain-containing protein [Saprospiraceae bacterium]|nr:ribonuclease H-like domain-containing protein [Saprospiraceae bacterium]